MSDIEIGRICQSSWSLYDVGNTRDHILEKWWEPTIFSLMEIVSSHLGWVRFIWMRSALIDLSSHRETDEPFACSEGDLKMFYDDYIARKPSIELMSRHTLLANNFSWLRTVNYEWILVCDATERKMRYNINIKVRLVIVWIHFICQFLNESHQTNTSSTSGLGNTINIIHWHCISFSLNWYHMTFKK